MWHGMGMGVLMLERLLWWWNTWNNSISQVPGTTTTCTCTQVLFQRCCSNMPRMYNLHLLSQPTSIYWFIQRFEIFLINYFVLLIIRVLVWYIIILKLYMPSTNVSVQFFRFAETAYLPRSPVLERWIFTSYIVQFQQSIPGIQSVPTLVKSSNPEL